MVRGWEQSGEKGLFLFLFFKKILFIYFQREGREGEREGEKHLCVVAFCMPPIGDLAWNRTSDLSVCSVMPNPLSHTSQGETVSSYSNPPPTV